MWKCGVTVEAMKKENEGKHWDEEKWKQVVEEREEKKRRRRRRRRKKGCRESMT